MRLGSAHPSNPRQLMLAKVRADQPVRTTDIPSRATITMPPKAALQGGLVVCARAFPRSLGSPVHGAARRAYQGRARGRLAGADGANQHHAPVSKTMVVYVTIINKESKTTVDDASVSYTW